MRLHIRRFQFQQLIKNVELFLIKPRRVYDQTYVRFHACGLEITALVRSANTTCKICKHVVCRQNKHVSKLTSEEILCLHDLMEFKFHGSLIRAISLNANDSHHVLSSGVARGIKL